MAAPCGQSDRHQQEFMILPVAAPSVADAIRTGAEVFTLCASS